MVINLDERVFWVVVFGASLYFCAISTRSLFLPWRESPLVMQLMDTKTPISAIPFPTVTICLDAKANLTMLDVTKMKEILTDSPKNLSDDAYVGQSTFHSLSH